MKSFSRFRVILWDFDGVLMDSMPVRELGFAATLSGYPESQVEQLLQYHRINGGLSRYAKFRYFFEKIRGEPVTDEQVLQLAGQFSSVVRTQLVNPDLIIEDSINFVRSNCLKFQMHVVSGSDGTELRDICLSLGLSQYFTSIQGSPTPKKELVRDLLDHYKYAKDDVVLIGDSINDKDAAEVNGISFCGYNNIALLTEGCMYIKLFSDVY